MTANEKNNNVVFSDINNYDLLTGLPLRRTYWKMADEVVLSTPGEFCMLGIDIEHFHFINKWYGRNVGDELLMIIGEFLKTLDKEYPTISGYMGGDNFFTVFPKNDELIEYIYTNINKISNNFIDSENLHIIFGGYITADKSVTVSDMCDNTSVAISRSIDNADIDICWFSDKMAKNLEKELELMPKIREGMKNNEFTFYLQPKCILQNGKIVGAEALMRWKRPDNTIIPPGEFIPFLEKNGFINQLDKLIWEEVIKTLRRWINEKRNVLPVSLNVSRMDIYTMDVVKTFKSLVEKYNVPTNLVEIEITESAYVENGSIIRDTEKALKEAGFKILIDDFGSGYSSLNMLKDVDADILKLDMKFLDLNETNTDKGKNIINAVLNMAHHLDLPTIAEGIETVEQQKLLEQQGCEYAQGYYFYKPMSISEYEKLIEDNNKIIDSPQTFHNRKSEKIYLEEISEYFYKIAEINPFTGEYHFIRNVNEPAFIKVPRPETFSDYVDRYINHGLIHPDDSDLISYVTRTERLLNNVLMGRKSTSYQIRYLIDGRYQWYTFEITKPKDFSDEKPWVLLTWKESDDDADIREDTLGLVYNSFIKVLKINLSNNSFNVIKADEIELSTQRGFSTNLSEWTMSYIDKNYIHPDDQEKYLEFMNMDNIAKHFKNSSEIIRHRFRRIVDNSYKWVELELSRCKDYSPDNQTVMLYLSEVRYIFDEESIKNDNNSFKNVDNIWDAGFFSFDYNLSKSEVLVNKQLIMYETFTGSKRIDYDGKVNFIANNYMMPEYKEVYIKFMNRERLIKHFKSGNQIDSIDLKSIYDNKPFWFRIVLFIYEDKTSGDTLLKEIIIDINENKKKEIALQYKNNNSLQKQLEYEQFKYTIQAQLYNAYRDPKSIITSLDTVAKMLGVSSAFLLKLTDREYPDLFSNVIWGESQKKIMRHCLRCNSSDIIEVFQDNEYVCYTMDDNPRYASLEAIGIHNIIAVPVYDINNDLIGSLGVINSNLNLDVKNMLNSVSHFFFMALQNIDAYNIIHKMGTIDLLTNLKNRNSYEAFLEYLFNRDYENFGCIYIDVNGLHELNNLKGHDAGDEMLKFVAFVIKQHFGKDNCFRIGGDEFVVLLTNQDMEMVPDINKALYDEIENAGYHISLGFDYSDNSDNFKNVIRNAEQKMYECKREFYKHHGGRRRSD